MGARQTLTQYIEIAEEILETYHYSGEQNHTIPTSLYNCSYKQHFTVPSNLNVYLLGICMRSHDCLLP